MNILYQTKIMERFSKDYLNEKYKARSFDPLVGYNYALDHKQLESYFSSDEIVKVKEAMDVKYLVFEKQGCIVLFRQVSKRHYNVEILYPDQWERYWHDDR